ncbi:hypothetical protein Bca52824_000119 [Brassica carinata]|uniref:DUF1985 domain-containing protein n=1 Tax=Brassica carinata TaxID=52824 RepID=A0A8X7WFS2_BRACI|nr:hypothetical protein Bca52824_000119 [Brassica carinata]
MVSSPVSDRFEDLSEADDAALPEMMFADGEEPVGVRVLTYQSSRAMNTILNALQEDEIQYIRASPFGKLVEIAEKPAFSGRFARFILSRQLKVKKLHEAWFRFAGKPIRFSLREFAIVTGLPCGELPEKGNSKRKKHTKGKPYWPELFGTVEELSVSRAVKMLRKRSVTDKVVRQKLACLAIVSSVLLPTNVKMKMLKEYAELLISLSKNTIALQGFPLALQLVIVEADEDNDSLPSKTKKQTLSPGYAPLVDKNKDAIVKSIIPQDPLRPIDESLLSYRDEVDDAKVRNLVHLISGGGATKLEVEMMRDKSKASGKKKMGKEVPSSSRCMEQSQIISVLTSLLKPEMERIDDRVTAALASVEQMSASALSYQASVVSVVEGMLKNLKDDILTSLRLSRAVPFMEQVNSACNSANMNNARTISNTPNPINTMIAPARPPTTNPFITPPRHKTVNRVVSGNLDKAQLRENNNNEVVIMNVLENLSHYSTPPKSAERCQVSDRRSQRNDSNRIRSPHKLDNNDESTTVSVNSHMNKTTEIRIPSFSLNVSQNVMSPGRIIDDEMGENVEIAVGDNDLDPNRTRNSKRLKLVPTPLLSGYQYDTAILNRSREAKLSGTNYYNNSLIREKFTKLIPILQTSWYHRLQFPIIRGVYKYILSGVG